MASVVTLFWNICILRAGPESVPARVWFAAVLILADIAVALLYVSFLSSPGGLTGLQAFGFTLVSIATVAVITRSVLALRGLDQRFLATLTALIGTDLLIGIVAVVVGQLSKLVGIPPDIPANILQIWALVVWGFIYQRAFNTILLFGILMAFGIWVLAIIVAGAAFGAVE